MQRILPLVLSIIPLSGCAAPSSAPPDWPNHPANPEAAAAPLPIPSLTLAVPDAATISPATAPTTHDAHGGHGGHK